METNRIPFPIRLALLLAGLLLFSGVAAAEGFTEPAQIRDAVVGAMGGQVSAGDVRLDSRLRLARCSRELEAVASGGRSVEVRCGDAPGWKIYVPVDLSHEQDVVVLTSPARAGVPLAAEQLTLQRRDVSRLAGAGFTAVEEVVGKVPTRGLAPGSVLLAGDVSGSVMLRRGDPVVLVSREGGIEVRAQGKAMGQAAVGGTVAVENTASRRIIKGRLVAEGVVEAGF